MARDAQNRFAAICFKRSEADSNSFHYGYTKEDLLCLSMLTGGVAKDIFMLRRQALPKKNPVSPFLTDGNDLLVGEMRKEYGVHFCILQLIASGKTSQSKIDFVILKNTGSYFKNLDKVFEVLKPSKSIFFKEKLQECLLANHGLLSSSLFKFIYAN